MATIKCQVFRPGIFQVGRQALSVTLAQHVLNEFGPYSTALFFRQCADGEQVIVRLRGMVLFRLSGNRRQTPPAPSAFTSFTMLAGVAVGQRILASGCSHDAAPQTAWGMESVLDLDPQRVKVRIEAGYDDVAKQLEGFLQH